MDFNASLRAQRIHPEGAKPQGGWIRGARNDGFQKEFDTWKA
jgi:hypothetical protein